MTPPDTDPNCCAWCGRAETPDGVTLPIGVGVRQCMAALGLLEPWRAGRRAKAIAALAEAGVA